VLSALPPRRQQRTDPPDLHSIEVEIYTGFDIRSVYQAHAQGRGSTYSWVFFASSQQTSPHYDRIEWAAEQLGIGLVQFQRSGASGTYKTRLKATKRSSTPDERLIFCENTGFIDSVRTP
jgi:ferredoxin-NADP reductase